MKFKALLLALACSPLAQAATVEQTVNLGSYGVGIDFAQTFTASRPAVSGMFDFSHFLNFTITQDLYAGSTITELSLRDVIDITNLEAAIFQGTCVNNVCTGGSIAYTDYISAGSHLTLDSTFAAGDYYVRVTGNIPAAASLGKYTLAATTLPVPEPETWTMLLVGMGLLGLRVRQNARASREAALA